MPPTWEGLFRQAVSGIIEAGAAVRASTSQLWAEIQGAAREAGLPIGQAGFRIVTELRSAAAARRNGYEAFQKAGPDAIFAQSMRAPEANIRAQAIREVQPEYLVRFDLTYTTLGGETETRTVSLRDVLRPGMTVGDVYDAVAEGAEGLARDYGQGLVGTANVRPVTI
jgi:hypothetical protein